MISIFGEWRSTRGLSFMTRRWWGKKDIHQKVKFPKTLHHFFPIKWQLIIGLKQFIQPNFL